MEMDFSDLNDKACNIIFFYIFSAQIIVDLREIIKANKINYQEIFEKYNIVISLFLTVG